MDSLSVNAATQTVSAAKVRLRTPLIQASPKLPQALALGASENVRTPRRRRPLSERATPKKPALSQATGWLPSGTRKTAKTVWTATGTEEASRSREPSKKSVSRPLISPGRKRGSADWLPSASAFDQERLRPSASWTAVT